MHLFSIVLACIVPSITGHGMVLDPVARGSRWRCNANAPQNVDDYGLFCGGVHDQWEVNGGKCGLCGDNYADERPRSHELGGLYGQGDIVKRYRKGEVIDVTVKVTANHKGYFEFNLCNLDANQGRETEECYGEYPLLDADGDRRWKLESGITGDHLVKVQLPLELTCEHCSLQWTYVAGETGLNTTRLHFKKSCQITIDFFLHEKYLLLSKTFGTKINPLKSNHCPNKLKSF